MFTRSFTAACCVVYAGLLATPAVAAPPPKPQIVKPGGDWRVNSVHMYNNFIESRKISVIRFPDSSAQPSSGVDQSTQERTRRDNAYVYAMNDASRRLAYARPLAGQGDRDAMYMLGWCYMQGNCGVPVDAAVAVEWLRKAGAAGHAWALADYGTALANGVGVPLDEKKSFAVFQEALARNGGAAAHAGLGMAYFTASGTAQDYAKALSHFRQAETDPKALGMLGLIHEYGFGVPVDDALASSYLKRAAALGDARAKAYYGIKLMNGSPSTPVNMPLARRYFEESMAANESVAVYNYAFLLKEGRHRDGGTPEPQRALELFTRAANAEYAPAVYEVAASYNGGTLGQKKDVAKAIELGKVAAAGGVTEAQDFLTVIYLNENRDADARASNDLALKNGTGLAFLHRAQAEELGLMGFAADTPTHVGWYQKAAALGAGEAQVRMGFFHLQRKHGFSDAAEGRRLLQVASDANVFAAHNLLAQCWEHGLGGVRDLPRAVALYKRASAGGSESAARSLTRLGGAG